MNVGRGSAELRGRGAGVRGRVLCLAHTCRPLGGAFSAGGLHAERHPQHHAGGIWKLLLPAGKSGEGAGRHVHPGRARGGGAVGPAGAADGLEE